MSSIKKPKKLRSGVERFIKLSKEKRFKGWQVVGNPTQQLKIPCFGKTITYKLQTGNGIEDYTLILRHFGWAVVFGLTKINGATNVITLCQWKPGVNKASWELPPGGIGKIDSNITAKEILKKTKEIYLKETGYGNGKWHNLGYIMIETSKYRGVSPENNGFKANLFLATDLEFISEKRKPNPNEIIETIMVPLAEFQEVLESGLFVEESAVACAYKSLLNLGVLKWSV